MLLLGTINTSTQDLAVDDLINFGSVYRRYDKRTCGVRTFELDGTSIVLQSAGIYHVTAVITYSADAAGDVTFSLLENNVATNEVTTTVVAAANNTTTLDYYVLVNNNNVLNAPSVFKTISVSNTGIAATVTNIVVNIDKVV